MFNLEDKKSFRGTLNEFINLVKEFMYHFFEMRDDKITERLVRYYVTEAIIPRPVREGKEVFYIYDHLIKFLFARKQIIDGWPMSKVKESMELQENQYFEEYLNGFQKLDTNEDAMSLIQEFKSEAKYAPDMNFSSRNSTFSNNKRVDIPSLKEALRSIDADLGNVVKQEFTVFTLASWLVFQIENQKLSGMTYEFSRKIGDAISSALIEKNPMTAQDLQKEFSEYKDNLEQQFKLEKLEIENEILMERLEIEKQEKIKSEQQFQLEIENQKNELEMERNNFFNEIKISMQNKEEEILETLNSKLNRIEYIKKEIENHSLNIREKAQVFSEETRSMMFDSFIKFQKEKELEVESLKEHEQKLLVSYLDSTKEFITDYLHDQGERIDEQFNYIHENEQRLKILFQELDQITSTLTK